MARKKTFWQRMWDRRVSIVLWFLFISVMMGKYNQFMLERRIEMLERDMEAQYHINKLLASAIDSIRSTEGM